VIAATLRCIARWGIAKTTLDDIAREADISRATVYRAFPGGKDIILTAVLQHEVRWFFTETTERLEACDTLADLLATGVEETHRFLRGHEALGFLLEHETDLVLTHLAMSRLDPVLAIAAMFAAPHLSRFIGQPAAFAHAEWVVRIILSYTLNPSAAVDLDDREQLDRFVATYFLPVLAGASEPAPLP
jgi:AcrR family transcriptional regulator